MNLIIFIKLTKCISYSTLHSSYRLISYHYLRFINKPKSKFRPYYYWAFVSCYCFIFCFNASLINIHGESFCNFSESLATEPILCNFNFPYFYFLTFPFFLPCILLSIISPFFCFFWSAYTAYYLFILEEFLSSFLISLDCLLILLYFEAFL